MVRGVKIMVSYSDITLSITILVSLLKILAGCRIVDHLGGFKNNFLKCQNKTSVVALCPYQKGRLMQRQPRNFIALSG